MATEQYQPGQQYQEPQPYDPAQQFTMMNQPASVERYETYGSHETTGFRGWVSNQPYIALIFTLIVGIIIGCVFAVAIGLGGHTEYVSDDPAIAAPMPGDVEVGYGGYNQPVGIPDGQWIGVSAATQMHSCSPNLVGGVWRDGSGVFSGMEYTPALMCDLGGTGDSGYIEFPVPDAMTTFHTTVGLADMVEGSDKTIAFQIIDSRSGEILWNQDVHYGDVVLTTVPVVPGSTIRLEVDVASDPGDMGEPATATWGWPGFE